MDAQLRKHAPGMGVSLSEADIWDNDYANVFWSKENAANLRSVKLRYDFDNILTNWGAVGFNKTDDGFRCYPN